MDIDILNNSNKFNINNRFDHGFFSKNRSRYQCLNLNMYMYRNHSFQGGGVSIFVNKYSPIYFKRWSKFENKKNAVVGCKYR